MRHDSSTREREREGRGSSEIRRTKEERAAEHRDKVGKRKEGKRKARRKRNDREEEEEREGGRVIRAVS